MTKDAIAELIAWLRRIAKWKEGEARDVGDSVDLGVLCEWQAATALEALQAENERLRSAVGDADRTLVFRRATQPKADIFYESPDAEQQQIKDLDIRIAATLRILRAAIKDTP